MTVKNSVSGAPDMRISGLSLGHGIVAMRTPWMAPGYPLHTEPDALDNTPFFDGLNRVV